MTRPHPQLPHRRSRTIVKSGLLLLLVSLIGVLLWQPWSRDFSHTGTARWLPAGPVPLPPVGSAQTPGEISVMRKLQADAMAKDGRVLEPWVSIKATGLSSRRHLQLALDEVFSLGRPGEASMVGRIRPRANREELEKFVVGRVASGAPATYPVLYVHKAPRVPGNLRIATGEIITRLMPGVSAAEIARAYGLKALPAGSSKVGLSRFVAQNAFRALELVPKLAADPRLSLVDHDFIKPVEPKALEPRDPMFPDQWGIFPTLGTGPQVDEYNIGLFPTQPGPSLLPNAAPVWGDFSDPNGGIRGRGIRVGIVDDGLELNHPDFFGNPVAVGEHRAYDLESQQPTFPGDLPPPRVVGSNGLDVNPLTLTGVNRSHGVWAAGIIGARADNNTGMAGVAPLSSLLGIRTYSWSWVNGFFEAPDTTDYLTTPGLTPIAPSTDVMIAAAFGHAANDYISAPSIEGKTIFPGTAYEASLPTFTDNGAGPLIHVKNVGFAAPDSGVVDAPGPETAGFYDRGLYVEGARDLALKNGRSGLGTVFVQAAGNGRQNNLENSNNDGYSNGYGAITAGALARSAFTAWLNNEDVVAIYSEWGANLTVVAPGGGGWIRKTSRTFDGRHAQGQPISLPDPNLRTIATTDWTVNIPAVPATSTRPGTNPLFGLNPGGQTTGEYTDGNYTKRLFGTSSAAAHVSGVVALMLEANPRLSWRDVQRLLILTARNHIDPVAYALDPTNANPPLRADGVDISDPQDAIAIDRDWVKNGAHLWFNHKYGAGLVDAGRAVAEAQRGILLPPQSEKVKLEFTNATQVDVPDAGRTNNAPPGEASMTFSTAVPQDFVITHVQLHFDYIQTPAIGELWISLTSPSGMESVLFEPRTDRSSDLIEWTFSSLRHWGENGNGEWRINFRDHLWDGNATTTDDVKVNARVQGSTANPMVRLILHGYSNPNIPNITRPASNLPAEPTVVEVPQGDAFTYTMSAGGRPTAWFVQEPLATPNNPGLPPGFGLNTITPIADNTYLDTRVISGRTQAEIGQMFDVEVIAANVAGFSEIHFLRFLIVPPATNDAFTQWGNFHFPPQAEGNPLALGSADPDGDGLINALEFGLGTSPMDGSSGGNAAVLTLDASSQWNFTFNRYTTRGSTYEVQVSDSLTEPSWRTVVRSNPALDPPDPGADGIPVSLDPANFTVSEGALVPAGAEPQSAHRVVTVVNNPATPPPLYYRLKVIPSRDPLNPR
jgi:hypothetical protein